jgi:hypothetical protein
MGDSLSIYRIAGKEIAFDRTLPGFDRLFIKRTSWNSDIPNYFTPSDREPLIRTEGWLLDQKTCVSLYEGKGGSWLVIPEAGVFWVENNGKFVAQIESKLSDEKRQLEALLGAPLIFALAKQDVWCLHASAALIDDGVVIFMGDSGSGKSTLVRYLETREDVHFVSDDILPVALENGDLVAYPHFPQLKRAMTDQPGFDLPEKLPVARIFQLTTSQEVFVESFTLVEGVQMLVKNSVATRLLGPLLLSKHLEFCTQAISILPVKRLAYPREMSILPKVYSVLVDDIS